MASCNKFLMPNILCPWGCTEYIHQCGHIEMDLMIQRHLPKCYLMLSNNHEQCNLVESRRDNYIRSLKEYDSRLFHPD